MSWLGLPETCRVIAKQTAMPKQALPVSGIAGQDFRINAGVFFGVTAGSVPINLL
jgi:hypothetical protein